MTRLRRTTASMRTLQRRQMLRRQPGLPPVEFAGRDGGRIRGKTPHPRGISVVLKGGSGARADAARRAPAVSVAAKASGTLPTTVLVGMGFAPEKATDVGHVRVATRMRVHPRKGGEWNGLSTQGAVFEGIFVDGSLREGKVTCANGEVQEGVYVIDEEGDYSLHGGRGKVTLKNGIMQ
ncbi:hypothetical protein THAOC_02019 [Thalassiosira oceanica]|uniref:Uncharacterized protein n=1 Tax=Thalassiosira oceanica TaxID=159749 RepID=K0TQL0_THAOC|nr:hypothetical protein THAOC_02019 [Thalassiosira oceanica]|eukprot:EJK76232.1 hypothetical protein THAOC_02019 [Thalassiosira oceanica]